MRRSPSYLGRITTFFLLTSTLFALFLFFSSFNLRSSSSFSSSPDSLFFKRGTPSQHAPPIDPSVTNSVVAPATSPAQQSPASHGPPAPTSQSSAPASLPPTTSSAAVATTTARTSVAQATSTAAAPTTTAAQVADTTLVVSPASTFTPSFAPSSLNPTPETTFLATYSYSGSVPYANPSAGSVVTAAPLSDASAKGFWHNKGAVGATFTFITLIGIAIVSGIALTVLKRRRRARRRRQRYLEKYNAAQARQNANDASTDGHFEEPEPSATEPMAPASTSAYPDRQVHYGATQMSQVDQAGYNGNGVGYLLGSDYATGNASVPQEQAAATTAYYQTGGYQQGGAYQQPTYQQQGYSTGYGQATQFNHSSSQATPAAYPSSQPYNISQNIQTTGLAPPAAYRQPAARGNGYDQSIDSFYGAPGANDATHAV